MTFSTPGAFGAAVTVTGIGRLVPLTCPRPRESVTRLDAGAAGGAAAVVVGAVVVVGVLAVVGVVAVGVDAVGGGAVLFEEPPSVTTATMTTTTIASSAGITHFGADFTQATRPATNPGGGPYRLGGASRSMMPPTTSSTPGRCCRSRAAAAARRCRRCSGRCCRRLRRSCRPRSGRRRLLRREWAAPADRAAPIRSCRRSSRRLPNMPTSSGSGWLSPAIGTTSPAGSEASKSKSAGSGGT